MPDAGVHFGFPIAVDAHDGRTAWVVPARADSARMAMTVAFALRERPMAGNPGK